MIFYDYSGAGNLFTLFDGREFSLPYAELSKKLCADSLDGLIVLEKSACADFKMRIFNRDGSEAAMCGNGLRCLIAFIEKLGIVQPSYSIETKSGLHLAEKIKEEIRVWFPFGQKKCTPISLKNFPFKIYSINTGVPHAVIFVESVKDISVETLGKFIRYHPTFSFEGTNVNFVSHASEGTFFIRTYERGVERETNACGTGAVAAGLIVSEIFNSTSSLSFITKSDATLSISFNSEQTRVSLQGPACFLQERHFAFNSNDTICIMNTL